MFCNGKEVSLVIPVLIVIVGSILPPELLGIASIQRLNEEIVDMSQLKMSWTPLVSHSSSLKHLPLRTKRHGKQLSSKGDNGGSTDQQRVGVSSFLNIENKSTTNFDKASGLNASMAINERSNNNANNTEGTFENRRVYALHCSARLQTIGKMTEESRVRYDYSLPYICRSDQPGTESSTAKDTEIIVNAVVGGVGLSFDFDYELDSVEDIVAEKVKENGLSEAEGKEVEQAILSQIQASKDREKAEQDKRNQKMARYSDSDRAAFDLLKFFKFYPQNSEMKLDHVKSSFINRYYGKAKKVF